MIAEINKIHNEPCEITMDNMPDNFVDLTVTSPPYDGLRKYNGYSFDFKNIAKSLYRITKLGGVVVWIVGDSTIKGNESGTSFKQALFFKETGFNLHDTMIYRKQNFIPLTHNRYEQEFEYMFVFSKGKPKTFNPIMINSKTFGKNQNLSRKGYGFKEGAYRRRDEDVFTKQQKIHGNIFEYATGISGCNHPAVFPEKLCEDHIISWSNEGDLVYDPFCGSGTTPKMAIMNKRNYICSEISEKYISDIHKRLKNLQINIL